MLLTLILFMAKTIITPNFNDKCLKEYLFDLITYIHISKG